MKTIEAADIINFETGFGESLCDSNHWATNAFTILGFAYGMSITTPIMAGLVKIMQREVDKYGYNTELTTPDLFEEWLGERDTDDQSCKSEAYRYYARFFAELINTIPAYNERWHKNVNELKHHNNK